MLNTVREVKFNLSQSEILEKRRKQRQHNRNELRKKVDKLLYTQTDENREKTLAK